MIETTVRFGNNNSFILKLPRDLEMGKLIGCLPIIINRKPEDILYLICNGMLVGARENDYNLYLSDFKIIHDQCTIYMILKSPHNEPRDIDLVLQMANLEWLRRHINPSSRRTDDGGRAQVPPPRLRRLPQLFANFDPSSLVDVPVVVSNDDFNRYVNRLSPSSSELDVHICSICSRDVGNLETTPVGSDEECVQLACTHMFHRSCIRIWLTTESVHCPFCNWDTRTL